MSQPAPQIGVKPYIPGRWSMTEAEARGILDHPHLDLIPSWLTDEARAVVKIGEPFWVST